jgi:hypothetical protein
MDLRPGKVREHRLAVTWDRFALLPGLERALDERVFETDFRAVSESSVQSLPNRVRMLREFSERRRAELTPVLEARLRR